MEPTFYNDATANAFMAAMQTAIVSVPAIYSILRGGKPERLAAFGYFITQIWELMISPSLSYHASPSEGAAYYALKAGFGDCADLLLFLIVGLRFNRKWPLVAAGFVLVELLAVATCILYAADRRVLVEAVTLSNVMEFCVLISMGLGVLVEAGQQRRNLRARFQAEFAESQIGR